MPRVASPAAAHVGGRIAEQRRRSSLTQDELAARCGIDSSNVRAYESGRAMVSVHSLVRLATALDVAPGDLLEGITLDMFRTRERRPGA